MLVFQVKANFAFLFICSVLVTMVLWALLMMGTLIAYGVLEIYFFLGGLRGGASGSEVKKLNNELIKTNVVRGEEIH